jgi:preprotein translocase subunit SecF
MVIGTISGTYSTVYVATPVLIWLNRSTPAGEGRLPARQDVAHSATR